MQFTLRNQLLFLLTAVFTILYLFWRATATLPFDYGMLAMFFGVLLLACETVAGFESLEQYMNMAHLSEPELPVIPDSWYPDIDVLITTHNEETDLVFKTVNACKHLAYPDKSKVHIYICDDTARPEMKALADKLGVGYFGLTGNKHAKAGNMNNAINQTSSPLLACFDADMIPRSSFLMDMVPYFFLPLLKKNKAGTWVERTPQEIDKNYKIGFVQAPQSFYNADLFQYNLYSESRFPNEQDYFFREINVGRNRSNSALFVGSNAVFSRLALEEVGGVATGTITEDFETGIRIQSKGYTTYAISKPLVHGMAPHTVSSLIKQRERWGRGCIQSLRNVGLFFRSGLGLGAKISYFACFVYWWTFARRLVYIIVPIVAVLFNVVVVECSFQEILLFWLPFYLLNNQTLKTLSGSTRNQHWNNLIDTILFPYLVMPVVCETLGIRRKKFVVTDKTRKGATSGNAVQYALPHIFLLSASLLSLVLCIRQVIETGGLYNFVIIFWLILNSKNLFFAICFMLGRQNYRKADRFAVPLSVEIEHDGKTYSGTTLDISATGISALLEFPVYLPDEQDVLVKVRDETGQYEAGVHCRIAHIAQVKEKNKQNAWRYCFYITESDEENKSQYAQIVYDRVHTLARKIVKNRTLYADFRDNIKKRLDNSREPSVRKHPRIPLGIKSRLENGEEVYIRNFDYNCALLESSSPLPQDALQVACAPDVVLGLEPVENFGRRGKGHLYRVLNREELMNNTSFAKLLAGGQPETI